jgi:hypothetical protein
MDPGFASASRWASARKESGAAVHPPTRRKPVARDSSARAMGGAVGHAVRMALLPAPRVSSAQRQGLSPRVFPPARSAVAPLAKSASGPVRTEPPLVRWCMARTASGRRALLDCFARITSFRSALGSPGCNVNRTAATPRIPPAQRGPSATSSRARGSVLRRNPTLVARATPARRVSRPRRGSAYPSGTACTAASPAAETPLLCLIASSAIPVDPLAAIEIPRLPRIVSR